MKYKNISNQEQVLIGYGKVLPDATISINNTLNNANFELVVDSIIPKEEKKEGKKEIDLKVTNKEK